MQAAFGKVNQMHTHVLPWTDRPLDDDEPGRRGRGDRRDAGFSVARLIPNPWFFLEATGRGLPAATRRCSTRRRSSDLTYVARLRGYQRPQRGGEHRPRDLVRVRAQRRRRRRRDHAAGRVRCDVPVPAAATRDLPQVPGAHRDGLEPPQRARRAQPQSFGTYVSRRVPVRAPLVRRRAVRLRGPRDRPGADRQGRIAAAHVLAERVQPDPRASTGARATPRGTTANEFLFQFLFSIGAHGAHVF